MSGSLQKQVISGLLWSIVRVWGNRLGGLLIFYILARLLTPEEFGIYAAVVAILLFLEVFTEQGLADAIIQCSEVERTQLNTVFLVNLATALVIFLALWLLAPQVAQWMAMPSIELPLRIASLVVVLNAVGVCQLALHRRQFAYRWLAIRTLIATVISGALGIALALAGYGIWALIVQYLLMSAISLVFLWIKPLWRPGLEFSFAGLGQLMRFSLKLTVSRLFDSASSRFFELAIGAWMGAATLGIYSVGARVYTIVLQLLSSVVLDVAHGGFSRLATDKERFLDAYYKSVIATAAIAVPVFVILAAVSQEFCVALFGVRWIESAPVLKLLALLGALQAVQSFNGAAINALGFSGVALVITIAKALATLTVLFFFGHQDLIQLVTAFVLGQLIVSPLCFVLGKRHVGFSWTKLAQILWPFLFASALSYASVALARYELSIDFVWWRLIVLSSIGVATYLILVQLIEPKLALRAIRLLRKNAA